MDALKLYLSGKLFLIKNATLPMIQIYVLNRVLDYKQFNNAEQSSMFLG